MTTYSLTNNESFVAGISANTDGSYCAITPSASKEFKTVKGASSWLAKRGFNADGSRK
ncbi:MAG: DUF1391 family protein [Microcoleus sp.]